MTDESEARTWRTNIGLRLPDEIGAWLEQECEAENRPMSNFIETLVRERRASKPPAPRRKVSHVGAPAVFALTSACQDINRAFRGFGCYMVGSALERPDWRDVDVRFIMSDEQFAAEFPDAGPVEHVRWESDPKWLLLTVAISERLSKVTGLPIDFQFQPQSHANARHKGRRNAIGLYFKSACDDD